MFFAGCGQSTPPNDPILPPGPPTGLTASDGAASNLVSLEWTASEGDVAYYRVYRAPVENGVTGEYTLRKDFYYPELRNDGTTASFDDNALSKSKIYSYRISAVNAGGESELSAPDTGYADALAVEYPNPPSNGFQATNNIPKMVYLDWTPVSGIATYHLYRSASAMGEYEKIATITDTNGVELVVTPETTLYYAYCDDSELWDRDGDEVPDGVGEMGKAYFYRVSSENADGLEGPKSDIINGWFPYEVPGEAPATVAATDGEFSNKVTVSWDAVAGATSYKIYRSDSTGGACETPTVSGSYVAKGISSGTSFDDTNVADETTYCYTVKSMNNAGESNIFSATDTGFASISTGVESPGNPTNVAATSDGVNQITVSWTRVDSIASHYLIYRNTDPMAEWTTIVRTVADNEPGGSDDLSWNDGDGSIGSVATDTTYYYKVKAVVYQDEIPGNPIVAESSLTDHASGRAYPTEPDAPTVTATDYPGAPWFWNRIDVSWTAVDRVVGYTLYRQVGAGSAWERLEKDLAPAVLSYSDTSSAVEAIWGTVVTYRVYATNSNPASYAGTATEPSETANFSSDEGGVELHPTTINASHSAYREITVTWSNIPSDNLVGSISYKLYRKRQDESNYSIQAIITYDFQSGGTYTYVDSGLAMTNKTYYYYVIPVMNSHEGPQSNVDDADSLF